MAWPMHRARGVPRSILDEQAEAGDHDHAGEHAAGCLALEHTLSGQGTVHEPDGHIAHLARICARTPSQRDLQALHRSAFHRQGPGCTSIHPTERSCCASTRSLRFKRLKAWLRCCPCAQASLSATRTTASAMAPPTCSPRSMSGRERSLVRYTGASADNILSYVASF
jgi:hypothetical protein